MSRKRAEKSKVRLTGVPSHNRFCDLLHFCVRGHEQPAFKNSSCDDHVAELSMLFHSDVDDLLWRKASASSEAVAIRKLLNKLTERIRTGNDLAAAETLYALATQAAFEILNLYLRHRELFDQITPRRTLLPCLISIHPKTATVTAEMEKASCLGRRTHEAGLIRSKAWFTSDAPANIYARAIVTSINLNQDLETVELQQKRWSSYERQYGEKIRVLPFPEFIRGIDRIPFPMTQESVLQYWRKGKEMIMEEMPDFHLRPEWKSYHGRSYKHGAKSGAIQHAIFKDILTALRTIAGENKAVRNAKPRKSGRALNLGKKQRSFSRKA